jgi:hypothetical protein
MASIEGLLIEDGMVVGGVSTNKTYSECTFVVASVEEWEDMTQEQADEALADAAFDSGSVEIYLKQAK